MAGLNDRRSSKRREARLPINMNLPNVSPVILGKTQNISLGGMKVKTEIPPMPFHIKDEVNFLVNRDYLKFEGQGEILWTSPTGDTVGIKLTQLDEKSRRSLEEFLSLFVDVPAGNH